MSKRILAALSYVASIVSTQCFCDVKLCHLKLLRLPACVHWKLVDDCFAGYCRTLLENTCPFLRTMFSGELIALNLLLMLVN